MVEYLQISCPSCQRTLRVRRQYAGCHVACSHCGHGFVVEPRDEPRESATLAERSATQAISESERELLEQQVEQERFKLQKVEQQLSEELAHAAARQREWEGKLVDLERELDQQREALGLESGRFRAEVDALQQKCDATELELDNLRAERGRLIDRCDAASTALRETEQRLVAQIEQLGQESNSLRQERDSLSHQVEHLNEEVRRTVAERTQLEEARQTAENHHHEELARLTQELKQVHDRNRELTEEIRALESKLAQPTTPAALVVDQQPIDELSRQLRKLQVQNEELRSVIHGLGITVG